MMNRSILGAVLAAILLLMGLVAWMSGMFGPAEQQAGQPPAAPARTAEPAPASPEPAPAAAPAGPSFDVVRIEPDGTAVLAGRAAPGAEVTVMDGDRALGTVTADSRGEWVLLPDGPLPPGARELRVQAKTPDGTVTEGADGVVLVVPERRRDIAGRPTDGTGGALAVLAPGEGAARVLQAPPADGAAEEGPLPAGEVAIDTVSYDRDGRVSVGGRAGPGAEVMIYLDNTLVGRTRADPQGRWQLSPDQPVEVGRRSLRADALAGGDGKVTARAEVPFERQAIDEAALGGRAVVVLPGNNLWTIARRSFGQGPQYTLIFQANQTQIRDPNLIYPGQIFILPGN